MFSDSCLCRVRQKYNVIEFPPLKSSYVAIYSNNKCIIKLAVVCLMHSRARKRQWWKAGEKKKEKCVSNLPILQTRPNGELQRLGTSECMISTASFVMGFGIWPQFDLSRLRSKTLNSWCPLEESWGCVLIMLWDMPPLLHRLVV